MGRREVNLDTSRGGLAGRRRDEASQSSFPNQFRAVLCLEALTGWMILLA